MARFKRRADGRYCKFISMGEGPDGKIKRKVIYGRTMKELDENIIHTYEAEKIQPNPGCEITMQEWANTWLKTFKPNISYNTRIMYETMISAHIAPAIGNLKLAEIQLIHIQNLLNTNIAKGHMRTAQKIYITLLQIFEKARKSKYIPENPVLDADKPKYEKPKKRALTSNEVKIIQTVQLTLKQKTFLLMLLRTGVRIGELMALHRSDLDFKNNKIFIHKSLYYEGNRPVVKDQPKSKAGIREIPILDDLKPTLIEYIIALDPNNDILFPSKSGGYMAKSACRYFWKKINRELHDAGIIATDITPHIFRHNYATKLVRSGADVKTVQMMMGHASPMVTLEIYAHEDETALEDARIRLNQQAAQNAASASSEPEKSAVKS